MNIKIQITILSFDFGYINTSVSHCQWELFVYINSVYIIINIMLKILIILIGRAIDRVNIIITTFKNNDWYGYPILFYFFFSFFLFKCQSVISIISEFGKIILHICVKFCLPTIKRFILIYFY